MKFYYVYVLNSRLKGFLYIGYSENLKQRYKEHNSGGSKSTKPYIPLDLIHYEAYRSQSDAKRREEYLKSNRGRTTLMTMLKDYFDTQHAIRTKTVRPKNALDCPICGGAGEAPTKSMFTASGKRTSGMVGFCMTCKGKGWILKKSE